MSRGRASRGIARAAASSTPVIRVDVSVLDWSLRCMAVMISLGEALETCSRGNRVLNSRLNYQGRANVESNDRVLQATDAFEEHLSSLMGLYSVCSEYLGNVWEHMSSLDRELAEQMMMDYAENNTDFINGLFG